ncbi:hypothetical protein INT43_004453 [Umbelopsis isabellina]|uniref:Uncharacterized protein n=1 Tax=Mortierella isabellina TaxID=91625 RepID=A0A8H7PIL7_MORIS|nr:hypothetical protein INT43_004453 [Umbelopsis isabellina]
MVFDRTADNRSHPNRQSFYSRTNYSAMTRHLSFRYFRPDEKVSLDDIVRLISYCNNLESICLCDQYLLRDSSLVTIFKHCPQLKHICLDGLYHISASVFQLSETKSVVDQIESLRIGSFYFDNPWQKLCFPSLKYLQLHMTSSGQLLRLLGHCRQTLNTLLITVHGWKTKSSDWIRLEQAFLEFPALKKLGLAVSKRNNANITRFGAQLNDIELIGPFPPETFQAISYLKKLKRLCLINCQQPTHLMEKILYNNKDSLITYVGDNVWKRTESTESPLRLSSSLRCLGFNPGGKQDWSYLDNHRNTVEQLHISMTGSIADCWLSMMKAAWPNVKVCFLCVDPLWLEDLTRLPSIFPNLEYISISNDICSDSVSQVYAIFNQFPHLRGGLYEPMLPVLESQLDPTAERLKRDFFTWESGTHSFAEKIDTILSPLVTLKRLCEDWRQKIENA